MTTLKKPLVSGIIIFLNGEPFIVEAIDSVFAQTYDNWELLLVDDGSSDNSTVIALDYAQKYPEKIRYLEHENHQNMGMSAARNLGIAHAKGDYVAFLDADDVWLPQKLAEQVAILEERPEVAMVYGRAQFWYSWTGCPDDSQRDYFMDLGVAFNTVVIPPTLLPLLWANKTQPPLTSNAMIRRLVFDTIGGFEDSFRNSSEDKVFFTKIELNAPVFVADNLWAKYRQHSDSITTTLKFQKGKKLSNTRSFFNWVEAYLIEQDKKDTEIWQTLQKTRLLYCQPFLYFFWRGYLEAIMSLGRKILPVTVRHYLWITIGSKLYAHRIKR